MPAWAQAAAAVVIFATGMMMGAVRSVMQPADRPSQGPAVARSNGRLRLGTFRSVWNAEQVRVSPALHFLHPSPRLEIAPADAQRLELFQGDRVVVGSNGQTVDATVTVRDATPEGTVFLETNALAGPLVEVRRAPPSALEQGARPPGGGTPWA